MAVRLRFRCTSKTVNESDGSGSVSLMPVVPSTVDDPADAAEIASFYQWTPGGQLLFSTINASAMAQFEEGRDYYITVEQVKAPEPASEPEVATAE
jgi:hypothetical protein